MIRPLIVAGIFALGLASSATFAEDGPARSNFQNVLATMNNVEWTIHQIEQAGDISDVRLVQLDDFLGKDRESLNVALALQQGTAQVDALRAAIAGNRQLIAELERQHISYMNIVAVDVAESGTITVYTFGASV